MGFERHNEFAVRFKFRELETCTTCYSPQIFHLDTSGYFYAILPCKIAADGKPVILFISHLPVRRPQFSSLENPPSLGTARYSYAILLNDKIAADGEPVESFILRSTVRRPLESRIIRIF